MRGELPGADRRFLAIEGRDPVILLANGGHLHWGTLLLIGFGAVAVVGLILAFTMSGRGGTAGGAG